MPHEVIRAEPGEDLSIVWSTVGHTPFGCGDALVAGDAEVLKFLKTDCPRTYETRAVPPGFRRRDAEGGDSDEDAARNPVLVGEAQSAVNREIRAVRDSLEGMRV